MPSTRSITVYKFSELAPAVRKKIIERWQEDAHEYFEASTLTDQFKERLEEVGLPHKDVGWRLSYSQGDGVAFYGQFSLGEYIKKNKLTKQYKGIAGILTDIDASLERKSRHYDHWNNMTVSLNVQGDVTPAQEALLKKLDEHIQEHAKDFSKELEKMGYQEIEYQTSEEQAKEHLEQDHTDFDVNGKQI